MNNEELGLGKSVYDSYPNRRMMKDISIGCVFLVFGIFIGYLGMRVFLLPEFISATIIAFIIIVSIIFIGKPLGEAKSRFQIFEKGMILDAYRPLGNSSKAPRGGHGAIGARAINFEKIVKIYPSLYSFGKSKYLNNIGFRIVISQEMDKTIVGDILFSGNDIKNIPSITNIIKLQMGNQWNLKYDRNEAIIIGKYKPEDVAWIVETGSLPGGV